jgi:uncharacterized protein (DUF934 family)
MLLDRNGAKPDSWSRAETLPSGASPILDWEVFLPRLPNDPATTSIGVELPNTFDGDAVQPHFGELALIVIRFPSLSDGRGFTLAKRLRRLGFTGTLRASGPLIPDQFAYTLACGFDEVELPEASAARQPAAQWTAALAARSQTYQRGYAGKQLSVLDQRRLTRTASHA